MRYGIPTDMGDGEHRLFVVGWLSFPILGLLVVGTLMFDHMSLSTSINTGVFDGFNT